MLTITASAQNERVKHWNQDISFLRKELPKKHVNFFAKKARDEFEASLKKLTEEVGSLSDLSIALRLQQIIASFGDSHTQIQWNKYCDLSKNIPIRFHWFTDGIYVLYASPENTKMLGYRISSINNVPIKTIIDSLNTLITIDNEACIKKSIPGLICYPEVLEHFGIVPNDSLELELISFNNEDTLHFIPTIIPGKVTPRSEYIKTNQKAITLAMTNADKFFSSTYLPEKQVYYIQYNQCWSKELEIMYNNGKNMDKMPYFYEFEEKVTREINADTITKLVFDLRLNSGGNSAQGSAFIKRLFEIEKVKSDMKVYVIIGRHTFSSAIINAMDFKEYTNVQFVGEETSGSPNHYGEVRSFQLPNSGLKVNYSTKYFKMTESNEQTLKPDIFRLAKFADYLDGFDPAFEYVLND